MTVYYRQSEELSSYIVHKENVYYCVYYSARNTPSQTGGHAAFYGLSGLLQNRGKPDTGQNSQSVGGSGSNVRLRSVLLQPLFEKTEYFFAVGESDPFEVADENQIQVGVDVEVNPDLVLICFGSENAAFLYLFQGRFVGFVPMGFCNRGAVAIRQGTSRRCPSRLPFRGSG